jgi:hypothetical protein
MKSSIAESVATGLQLAEPEDPDVQRAKVRCVIPLGATSDVTP